MRTNLATMTVFYEVSGGCETDFMRGMRIHYMHGMHAR